MVATYTQPQVAGGLVRCQVASLGRVKQLASILQAAISTPAGKHDVHHPTLGGPNTGMHACVYSHWQSMLCGCTEEMIIN